MNIICTVIAGFAFICGCAFITDHSRVKDKDETIAALRKAYKHIEKELYDLKRENRVLKSRLEDEV